MRRSIHARPIASAADRNAAYAVRRVVFQDEQHVPAELEFDADDESAFHVVATVDGTIVGTGRLVVYADYAKVGRMAVLREWRSAGVGRALLDALTAEAVRRAVPRLILHAQVQAMGFYRRCGFAVVGEEFDEAGIPHRRMERALSS